MMAGQDSRAAGGAAEGNVDKVLAARMGKVLPASQNGELERYLRARRRQDRTSVVHRPR
jgi:hypothetical protein